MKNPLARLAVQDAIRSSKSRGLSENADPEAETTDYADDTPEEDDRVQDYTLYQENIPAGGTEPAGGVPPAYRHSSDPYSQQLEHMRNLLQYETNPQVRNHLELNIQDLMRARMRAGIR